MINRLRWFVVKEAVLNYNSAFAPVNWAKKETGGEYTVRKVVLNTEALFDAEAGVAIWQRPLRSNNHWLNFARTFD